MCLSDISGMHRAGVRTDCNRYDSIMSQALSVGKAAAQDAVLSE